MPGLAPLAMTSAGYFSSQPVASVVKDRAASRVTCLI